MLFYKVNQPLNSDFVVFVLQVLIILFACIDNGLEEYSDLLKQ